VRTPCRHFSDTTANYQALPVDIGHDISNGNACCSWIDFRELVGILPHGVFLATYTKSMLQACDNHANNRVRNQIGFRSFCNVQGTSSDTPRGASDRLSDHITYGFYLCRCPLLCKASPAGCAQRGTTARFS
jgi:hypothetical protein